MALKQNPPSKPVRNWDPWKTYDLSEAEIQARKERAAMRLENKKKFQKLVTDPHSFGKGHIFDPAVQRYIAMKATEYDYFKPTPKSAIMGLMVIVAPVVLLSWFTIKYTDNYDKLYRSGGVRYADREWKFHS